MRIICDSPGVERLIPNVHGKGGARAEKLPFRDEDTVAVVIAARVRAEDQLVGGVKLHVVLEQLEPGGGVGRRV